MILKKTEPLTGKLGIHKDVPVMGKGMMVEVSTWRATKSFCSIVKKFSGTFSGSQQQENGSRRFWQSGLESC